MHKSIKAGSEHVQSQLGHNTWTGHCLSWHTGCIQVAYRLVAAHLPWHEMLGLGPCSSMSMRLRFLCMLAGHVATPSRQVVVSQAEQLEEVKLIVRSWNGACSAQTLAMLEIASRQ